MVNVRMTVGDLASTRFAFSPLAEVGLSLYLLAGGDVKGLHQAWCDDVRPALAGVDMELLCSVVPRRGLLADFLFVGAADANTRIETQLGLLAEFPLDALEAEVREVWQDPRSVRAPRPGWRPDTRRRDISPMSSTSTGRSP
ncbi:MAG TPA: hypothetical protein VJT16_15075 [Streptosporangiaceae bacterium]|nr:hypothetical protein [Streptosporangiaceae bacterium]